MVSGFIRQFTGLLIHPRSTLASLKETPLRFAFIYFCIVWTVFAALLLLIGPRLEPPPLAMDQFTLVWFVVLVFIGWLFLGLVVQVFLRIVTGPGNITKTYRAVLYSATPLAVIGWIPFITGLSFIWGLVILKRGLEEYHEISGVAAFLIPILAFVIAMMVIGIAYFSLLFAVTLAFP
jgi:hypothetical protein